jgi:hypothetical protein
VKSKCFGRSRKKKPPIHFELDDFRSFYGDFAVLFGNVTACVVLAPSGAASCDAAPTELFSVQTYFYKYFAPDGAICGDSTFMPNTIGDFA